MYVLVIGRSYPNKKTGMMGIFEFEQAIAFKNYGHRTVYSFCDTRSVKRLRKYGYVDVKKNGVEAYGYYLPIGGIPKRIFNRIKGMYYRKILRNIQDKEGIPDIIHVHFPLLTLNDEIWSLLKKLNRPIVVTEHWSKVQTKELSSQDLKFLKRLVDEADEFICVGDSLRRSVIELTNTTKDIKVVPNMISPLFFYQKQESKGEHFEFIAVGRLVGLKRFGLIIDTFTEAFGDNRDVHLTIVGDGPLFNEYKRKINYLDMDHRISMTGFLSREETSNIIRKSDVFISASILETFGVPFIEAMACGKPVVGIRNGPIDMYITTNNGLLFEQDNFDDLVKTLIKMYENRKKYDGKKISQIAMELFSEETVIKELEDIFVECIKKYN